MVSGYYTYTGCHKWYLSVILSHTHNRYHSLKYIETTVWAVNNGKSGNPSQTRPGLFINTIFWKKKRKNTLIKNLGTHTLHGGFPAGSLQIPNGFPNSTSLTAHELNRMLVLEIHSAVQFMIISRAVGRSIISGGE